MNKKIKFITALLSVIFCISLCLLPVWADEGDAENPIDVTVEPPAPTQPVEPEPEPEPEPTTAAPVVTEAPTYAPVATEPPTYAPVVTEPPTANNNWSGGTSSSNNDDGQIYYNNDSDSSYVGGGQTYVPPASTAAPAAMYETDNNIDDNELSKNDWKDIAANLKNAGTSESDSDDFSFIQNDKSSGDNGRWMLVTGVLCLLLSVAGIAYVIVSCVMRRKKFGNKHRSTAKRQYAYVSSPARSSDDYGDGYRQPPKREQKSSQRKSKYDTADIDLSKSGTGRGNGRRYR